MCTKKAGQKSSTEGLRPAKMINLETLDRGKGGLLTSLLLRTSRIFDRVGKHTMPVTCCTLIVCCLTELWLWRCGVVWSKCETRELGVDSPSVVHGPRPARRYKERVIISIANF